EKGIIGVRIEEDDRLLTAAVTDGTRDLLIGTRSGQSIRFSEEQVRPMGRNTAGVKGIELEEGDEVVGLAVSDPKRTQVLSICERGFGKRTPLDEFRHQNRGGKGIILIDASERNGPVAGLALARVNADRVIMTDRGQAIRVRVAEIRETGRNAQGVKIMDVAEGERVVAMETLAESETDESEAGRASGEGNEDSGDASQ